MLRAMITAVSAIIAVALIVAPEVAADNRSPWVEIQHAQAVDDAAALGENVSMQIARAFIGMFGAESYEGRALLLARGFSGDYRNWTSLDFDRLLESERLAYRALRTLVLAADPRSSRSQQERAEAQQAITFLAHGAYFKNEDGERRSAEDEPARYFMFLRAQLVRLEPRFQELEDSGYE